MRVALGLKAHSGWAALVGLGEADGQLCVVERRRVELASSDAPWAKQPYHAAESLGGDAARDRVARGIDAARRHGAREIGAVVDRLAEAGHEVFAVAVLAAAPMPAWSVDEILAVHFRMHQAEGALFRDALSRGAAARGLPVVDVLEKTLLARASRILARPAAELEETIARLGKEVGAPWGKDQKTAALAAWVALSER